MGDDDILLYEPLQITVAIQDLRGRLDNFTSFPDQLCNFFVLVRQQAQRKGNVIPLPFILCTLQSRGKLRSELFGVFVLKSLLVKSQNRKRWLNTPSQ